MLQLLLALHLTISPCGRAPLTIEIPEHSCYCIVRGNPDDLVAFGESWFFAAWGYTDHWRWYISEEMDQNRYDLYDSAAEGVIYMGYESGIDSVVKEAFDFAMKEYDGQIVILRTEKY